ncbi:hypothetical protein [Dactylosporangium matsuzakiense]|uniref:Uncharacterized protein n=1 Tax=Dactylosporangium matsuzakiense TaxID=53360 RepID=A0A9W6NJZ3_9ACTN|nr:hypothetical protein [Dactylosporangium matsuzakiense]UWZ44291.1 hypothetical protein Dmats_44125 [Dactylosporangium matsuzakiense]GLK99560.1 hypothetical protein GCM10017581_013010 [Dactylosporangium matsuzakiense]
MQIGSVQLYLGHGHLFLGATSSVDLAVFDGDGPVTATEHHVRIAARPQVGPVRVRLWQGAGPRVGKLVFDGPLKLPDAKFCVEEGSGLSRYVTKVTSHCPRVLVAVDDPGHASRVEIVFEPEFVPRSAQVWTAGEPPFPKLTVSPTAPRHRADAFADALSGHDFAHRRLAAALLVVAEERRQRNSEQIVAFYINDIVEWLRWLNDRLTYEMCRDTGRQLLSQLGLRSPNLLAADTLNDLQRRLGHPLV